MLSIHTVRVSRLPLETRRSQIPSTSLHAFVTSLKLSFHSPLLWSRSHSEPLGGTECDWFGCVKFVVRSKEDGERYVTEPTADWPWQLSVVEVGLWGNSSYGSETGRGLNLPWKKARDKAVPGPLKWADSFYMFSTYPRQTLDSQDSL